MAKEATAGPTKKLVVDLEPELKDFLQAAASVRKITIKDLVVELIKQHQNDLNGV